MFCSIPRTVVRSLSHENILDAVKGAANCGIKQVSFADDWFVQDTAWTRRMMEILIEAQTGIRFRAQTYPSRVVWNLLALMARAGFDEPFLRRRNDDLYTGGFLGQDTPRCEIC